MIDISKGNSSCNIEFEQVHEKGDYRLSLKKETEHFIIYHTEMDKKCIDEVSQVLEKNYNKITKRFNQQVKEKITIEIHSDRNQLQTALGLVNAPEWIRGGVGDGKIIIASPLNPPPGSKFENVVNTAVHEFVHIIVDKINGNTPRWLNEGIACYEAKDNNQNWIRTTVINGLKSNKIPTFKELDTGEDFERFFISNGYQFSYTIVESIIEEFGYDKLYSLIKSPNKFVDIFGITENQLENKWVEYIKKNYL